MKHFLPKSITEFVCLIAAVFSSLSAYAIEPSETGSYLDHLTEVNEQWSCHTEICPDGSISFESDRDRIQLHLSLVIEYLESKQTSHLSETQYVNRMTLLDRLQQYADAKVFPINKYHFARRPYFVDERGTHCAVGQMIHLSGYSDLVAKVKANTNYNYLIDIRVPEILQWAAVHGFTLEELEWIQPTYMPEGTVQRVGGGTNGPVNKVVHNEYNGSLTIVGDFTELDSLPCLNIGYYKEEQLHCFGDGLEGVVHYVINHWTMHTYAFGELVHDGEVFPVAMWDGSQWSYIRIPGRSGAICTAASFGTGDHLFEMAISHPAMPGYQEIGNLTADYGWDRLATVKGGVLDIEWAAIGKAFVGHLDSVYVYDDSQTIETKLDIKNILIRSYHNETWYGVEGEISDTVNVVTEIGGALYFGGTCGADTGSDVCVSKYLHGVLQPVLVNYYQAPHFTVSSLMYDGRYSHSHLVIGGEFSISPIIGIWGSHLAIVHLINNTVEPIAALDKPVFGLSFYDGELYIGGEFQKNLAHEGVTFLAKQAATKSSFEVALDDKLLVYPNPFDHTLYLSDVPGETRYYIFDIEGRLHKSGNVVGEQINGLVNLPKGTYMLRLESADNSIVRKLVK